MRTNLIIILMLVGVLLGACLQVGERAGVSGVERNLRSGVSVASESATGVGSALTGTCGDGVCDAGEQNYPNFCEQDCAFCQPMRDMNCNVQGAWDPYLEPSEGCMIESANHHYCSAVSQGILDLGYGWAPDWVNNGERAWHVSSFNGGAAAQQGSGVSATATGNAVMCSLSVRAAVGDVGQAALLCGGGSSGSPFVLKNGGGCPYDCSENGNCEAGCSGDPRCPPDYDCCQENCSVGNGCNPDCNNAHQCRVDPDCEGPADWDTCCSFCGDGFCDNASFGNSEIWDPSRQPCWNISDWAVPNALNALPCHCDPDCDPAPAPLSCSVTNGACEPPYEQVLLTMSSEFNAHAATDGSYSWKLCCTAGGNVLSVGSGADPGADVVQLSSTTNAHVSVDGTYSNHVKLGVDQGSVQCTTSFGSACDPVVEGDCVFSFSSQNNAHIGACSGTGSYNNYVCCKIVGGPA